jgi:photosystem II stability/assembly factor-like uncharacterized protein
MLALGTLWATPVPADPPLSHEQQIAELEKQIEALKKKLEELRKAPAPAPSLADETLPADWVKALAWRCIGPANMGGRITAISAYEADPSTFWVATASGGLLKTVNNGVTFEHQFDHEATVSIGDVCVAPSDAKIVWVGTGEGNPRNSVSYGDGVYKSTDGGKHWQNMGLNKSFQIGRILVHPKNPDIVYVGALGRLYGPSQERGLFKTTDGGKNWEKVLTVDDKTGVIDMRMHPTDPETLLVASYERQRDGYDVNEPAKRNGPGSGIWKTTDGGKTFRRIRAGLPTGKIGRIGLDWYRKDPQVVFAILESEKTGMAPPGVTFTPAGNGTLGFVGEDAGEDKGVRITTVFEGSSAEKAGLEAGDQITRIGDKPIPNYEEWTELLRGYRAGDKVTLKVVRTGKERNVEVTFAARPGRGGGGGGGSLIEANRPFGSSLAGQMENVQDKQVPDGFEYGGVYRSADGGETWKRVNSLTPRPMYFSQVRVDPSDDKHVYVLGVAIYRSSDGGTTFKPDGGRGVHPDAHALWIDPRDGRHMVLGGDGGIYATWDRMTTWDRHNHVAIGQFYHVAIDPRPDYRVYGGLQDNGTWGGPSRTHGSTGPVNEDWVSVGGGDGFRCQVDPHDPDQVYFTSQWGAMGRRNFRTGEVGAIRPRPPQGTRYHWNWNTPFVLSHHNSRIFYCAGNYVFRSLDRGNNLEAISPEITAAKEGSGTALAESPRNPNVLWAGTDDGNLWVTRDGGKAWVNVTKNAGLPGPRWVASIEASRAAEGRAYVVFDGHRSDDDEPYVFVTEDYGKTFQSLRANLPWGSTRVLREDVANHDLLLLGTEFAAWASLDRGRSWTKINNNLPTVAVHEFAIHPSAGEVVAATHGRSLWVCDIAALRQITAEARKAEAFLYRPTPAVRWRPEPTRGSTGRHFSGENPAPGATLWYSLGKTAEKASLAIVDIEGKTVRTLSANASPGLHKVVWNLSAAPPRRQPDPSGAGPGGGGGRGRFGGPGGRPVPPGAYKVVLSVDGKEYVQSLRVLADPAAPSEILAEEEDDGGDR